MNDKEQNTGVAEREIDLIDMVSKLWASRRFILKWVGYAAVLGLVVAFSIPAEYNVSVKMVAEDSNGKAASGGMSQLMNLAGISSGDSFYGIGVMMYPEVASSVPFLADMRNIEVQPKKAEQPMTLFEYLTEYQKSPWWSSVISVPFRILGWVMSLFSDREDQGEQVDGTGKFDPFFLTKKQSAYVGAMRSRVGINLDKQTGIISANVTMQDPVIAAVVADSLVSKLTEYIILYRTDKARQDMAYGKKAFEETKAQYYQAQQRYAAFVDQNQNITRQSVIIERNRLQNDVNLAFSVHNAMAQQLENVKLKLQEQTPCVTVIEPASVPLSTSKPKKKIILLGFMFLGGIAACGYLVVKDLWGQKSSSSPK